LEDLKKLNDELQLEANKVEGLNTKIAGLEEERDGLTVCSSVFG
jgi:hypothetical protein